MEIDRRYVLRTGALVAGAAFAGCLDAGEESDDAETHDPPDELAITNPQLLAEEPSDYREYDVVEDRQYSADAIVWFYFEPVGVTTEDAGAGQERIELTSALEVTYRDETVATTEEEFRRDVPEGATEELYLFFHFTPRVTPARPGRYGAELSLTDELAGESVTEEVSFTIEEDERHDHGIEHVRFVEGKPTGYREYTAVADPVYRRDEPIWIYFEPTGVGVEERDNGRFAEFDATATITDPDGESVGRVSDELTIPIPRDRGPEELFVYFDLDLRRSRPGEHTVELDVRDRVLRGSASETVTFRIEDPKLERVEIFREVLEDETDIDIDRLRLVDDGAMLRLSYQSAYTYEEKPEEFGGEVGYIAGAYAGLIDESFSPDRLHASGEDRAGTEFTYVVETDLARQYLDEEITSDEFVDRVFERLRI